MEVPGYTNGIVEMGVADTIMETKPEMQPLAAKEFLVRAGARCVVVSVSILMALMAGAASLLFTLKSAYCRTLGGCQSLKERFVETLTGKPPEIPTGLSENYQKLCLEARGYVVRILKALESLEALKRTRRREIRSLRRSTPRLLRSAYQVSQRCQQIEEILEKERDPELQDELSKIRVQLLLITDPTVRNLLHRSLRLKQEKHQLYEQVALCFPPLRESLGQYITKLKNLADRVEAIANGPRRPRGGKRQRIFQWSSAPPKRLSENRLLPC